MWSTVSRYAVSAVVACFLAAPSATRAHCDSIDGPVVRDARQALENGDVTPVLKWVSPEHEQEVRSAFELAGAARTASQPARVVADRYFFETVVRIHRAGEGEPYTGLKAAGSVDPGIAAADEALVAGSADELATEMGAALREGIAKRFKTALERRKSAGLSVESGRQYVESYVDYIHFVENAHRLVSVGASHEHHDEQPAAKSPKAH